MKKIIFFLLISFGMLKVIAQKHIGINTGTPLAALHVADSSVLFSGPAILPITATPPPVSGAGTRMMWYADNAAFRSGGVSNTSWDKSNVGQYSFAAGFNAKASGFASNAWGISVTASGNYSMATGHTTTATGPLSTAFGNNTLASGSASTAAGHFSIASGDKSFALGDSVKADGYAATAMGFGTHAFGDVSTSMGENTTASGEAATAIGVSTIAVGPFSFASGGTTTASGNYSTAMGINSSASGNYSTAMGYNSIAAGNASAAVGDNAFALANNSFAIGNKTRASGINSTAMGNQSSTNNHTNSFCIGGTSDGTINILTANSTDNQMMMRFDNYTFWVSASNYAYLVPASNGWAYTSDKNKKEKFEELDGESVLKKISSIPFYSWNFKSKDVQQYRHYGIMAQDFYTAFGKDSYGTIGNDTTVSPLDLLGVAYSGIKALEKRSTALANENAQLIANNIALQTKIEKLENLFAEKNIQLADKLTLMETKLNKMVALNQNSGEKGAIIVTK